MRKVENNFFCIAGHTVSIRFSPSDANDIGLLPSFAPFRIEEQAAGHLLLTLDIDDTLRPASEKTFIRKFDTGNGDTLVWKLPDGGYQYVIRDIHDRDCCLLLTNADFSHGRCALNGDAIMRSFGLNDALMLIFAFAGSFHQTLLIHASCVLYKGKAYPFTAQSGTGKSTHVALWLQHIQGAELLNDDNPILRVIDGKPVCYGSPWSGKTPCYRNRHASLGAVTLIERAPQNSIERQSPLQAFASLLPSCSSMKWDGTIYKNICDTITRIIETTPVYTLHCLPDAEAAHLCQSTIAR